MYHPIGLYSIASLASTGFTAGFPAASTRGSFNVKGVGPEERPLKIIRWDERFLCTGTGERKES